MHKFLTVFKREYAQVVKKKSFLIGLLLTPVMMAAFTVLPALLATKEASETEQMAIVDQTDYDGGARLAESLKQYELDDGQPYYSVTEIFTPAIGDSARLAHLMDSLRALINEQDLKYFIVLKADAHLVDSNAYLVSNSDNFVSMRRFENRVSDVLSARRLDVSDVNLEIDSVLSLAHRIDLRREDAKGESIPFQVKYFTALVFVGIMFGYGQLVMRSVIEEKNSRIMEVLVSSVTPFQLMMGKILGLGAATFTQVGAWAVMGGIIYALRGVIDMDPSIGRIVFNPAIITFFVLFLSSGYLLYSSLFAIVGSICNNDKEAQSFISPMIISMILPFMVAIHVIQHPNSLLSVVLSFIPFLTPTMMCMRVIFIAPTLTEYSLFSGIIGQAILGFILVSLTFVGVAWLAGKIFRIGILMYGKRPTLPEIIKWVRY